MCIKLLYNDNLRKLPNEYGDVSVMHHLVRRKETVADTGLLEFKDLQKTALTYPLAGEGIFAEEFEKLKNRQEKDKQLSELMPEVGKRSFLKRNLLYHQIHQLQRKPETLKIPTVDHHTGLGIATIQAAFYSSGYKNNTSRSNSVSGFRPQEGKSNRS